MKIKLDKFRLCLLGISLLTSFSFNAQTKAIDLSNVRQGESVEYCITHKKMHALMSDPAYAAQHLIDQQNQAAAEQQLLNQSPVRVIYKIPVVFHVLHNNGLENISDAQILEALDILNRDYRLLNSDALNVHNDFKASNPAATCTPSDAEIEFVLATKAPNGACFSGITRTVSSATVEPSGGGQAQVAAIVNGNNVYNGQWPGNKYMNVFIAAEIGGAAGYTTNPSGWSANSMQNGIWILHNYVGASGTSSPNSSRALTHEVGHWLNLSHTWGGNNNPGNATSCSTDDGVTDTPNTIGVTACLLNEASCGPRANVENYMDYSYCSKMFSNGQVNRMRAALTANGTGRSNIWTPANLVSVGADGTAALCAADFSVPKETICAGESVAFYDQSYNAVSGWTWTFQGGTPASSSAQNPTVTYATPGTYTVTLAATDGSTSDTEIKTGFITVLPAGTPIPYYESFESYNQTSDVNKFEIFNSATNATWELATNAGSSGSKSMKLANFTQTGTNFDELSSSPLDLSSITASTGVTLSFRYAYRKKISSNSELLKVFLTADCGDTWQQRKTITGNSLSTIAVASDWTPTPADWTTVHMTNVTSQYWVDNFRFKFRFDGSGGNNVFLDDINIYPGSPSNEIVLGIDEKIVVDGLSVYPNPSEGELNVAFNVTTPKPMNFVVTDIMGKTIQTQSIQASTGSNLVLLSTENMAKGMYLLQITDGSSRQVIQFLVK